MAGKEREPEGGTRGSSATLCPRSRPPSIAAGAPSWGC